MSPDRRRQAPRAVQGLASFSVRIIQEAHDIVHVTRADRDLRPLVSRVIADSNNDLTWLGAGRNPKVITPFAAPPAPPDGDAALYAISPRRG
jgi:hypothetical protein